MVILIIMLNCLLLFSNVNANPNRHIDMVCRSMQDIFNCNKNTDEKIIELIEIVTKNADIAKIFNLPEFSNTIMLAYLRANLHRYVKDGAIAKVCVDNVENKDDYYIAYITVNIDFQDTKDKYKCILHFDKNKEMKVVNANIRIAEEC